jgi:undecaprenyl pyrophosphate phosphatase UppP
VTLLQIVVLAIIRGLAEFLPVSGYAHLILGSKVFGWP